MTVFSWDNMSFDVATLFGKPRLLCQCDLCHLLCHPMPVLRHRFVCTSVHRSCVAREQIEVDPLSPR